MASSTNGIVDGVIVFPGESLLAVARMLPIRRCAVKATLSSEGPFEAQRQTRVSPQFRTTGLQAFTGIYTLGR
jgi:hypothetical protein